MRSFLIFSKTFRGCWILCAAADVSEAEKFFLPLPTGAMAIAMAIDIIVHVNAHFISLPFQYYYYMILSLFPSHVIMP